MTISVKIDNKTLSYTTDSSLLRHVQNGDDTAWDMFYQKYTSMIYSIGKKKQLSAEECDDLMINVMTVFWKKMDEFIYDRNRGKFRNYLGKIAGYCAMQILSRKKSHDPLPSDSELQYPADVDESIMNEWQDYIIEKALEVLRKQLDTEVYQVFYMSFIQKRSVHEISSVTRRTPNNIYVIRSRCLKKLSSVIKELRQLDCEALSCHSHKNKLEY